MKPIHLLLLLFLAIVVSVPEFTPAADIAEDRGAMGLSQALKRLDAVGSVLHTGAHPDDENSGLLAWLSRGRGIRTAYLSATRGDGGQNLLGTELFEALGVIRTEELLAARRFDRAQQFFTPNYEFGFSKTAEESFEKWGHDQVLGDFVRIIRQFKPEIVISRFTGTPADGHGHHQVAGVITREAFRAAGDAKRFPEYGQPWQAKKLYLNAFGNSDAGIGINIGEYDPALGRSFNEIAMEGRSLHRSQSQGAAREKGPRLTRLQLVDKTVDVSDNEDLFSGTIQRLSDLSQLEPALSEELMQLQQQVNFIREKANFSRPSDLTRDLGKSIQQLRQIRSKARNDHVRWLLESKEADFYEAARLSAGLVVDVVASDDSVIPGQEFNVSLIAVNGGPFNFPMVRTNIDLPAGWTSESQAVTGALPSGQRFEQKLKVKVPVDAVFTQPYWLKAPKQGDRFVWPEGSPVNMPFDPPILQTRFEVDFEGAPVVMSKSAERVVVDNLYGELRSEIKVVPALSVRISPEIAVIPVSGERRKEFTVTIENQSVTPVDSEVRLIAPPSWTIVPATRAVKFSRQGEKASVQFMVTAPAVAGDFTVEALAVAGGKEYRAGYQVIAYPHVETRHIYAPARSRVEVFDVRTSVSSIGYIAGAGDRVAESLRQIGLNVVDISATDLARGDLSRFQTIVLGIRAYAAREDVRAYNNRLLEYVRNGGTLIVQYNTYEILDSQFGPYPFTISRPLHDRVTKEDAEVRILDPANRIFNFPNKITDKDFEGWVQERGLYYLGTWDSNYKPLLESHDPGENPKEGGLVVAKYGKGSYVYTGYGFFRQMPAGVPGAYRLFANLVSIEN